MEHVEEHMGDKHSSNKILATIIALVIALIGGTGWVVATHTPAAKDKNKVAIAQPAAVEAAKTPTPVTHLSYSGVEGKTALELLKAKATIVTKQSAYGEYVDSINGVKGGTNNKYWTFYVNGTMAQVGADTYKTKGGDTIEWKFE
jgi:hypothetical protein